MAGPLPGGLLETDTARTSRGQGSEVPTGDREVSPVERNPYVPLLPAHLDAWVPLDLLENRGTSPHDTLPKYPVSKPPDPLKWGKPLVFLGLVCTGKR